MRGPVDGLLEVALDEIPVGIVVEAKGGRIVHANRYAQELLDAGSDVSPIRRALAGDDVRGERVEVALPDGSTRVLSLTARPLREDGRVVAAVALFEDVSARLRVEQAEREFLANAAHELRTPLAAIASAVEVLQAGAKELPTERDVFLAHIERESARLALLARALLVLARAQARSEQPRIEVVALRPLLEQIAADVRPARGVKVSVECPSELAALANRDLLAHALVNLAGNAAHHTERGGICLRVRSDRSHVAIEVSDTGSGMEPDVLERAFDRFFSQAASRGDRFGLGLAIAKELVESVGGSVGLASAPGAGTTATIRLPLARMVES